jgi:predicted ABC-type transport system involved in lysophospholipase L1 biosynthesis ATPase subunit
MARDAASAALPAHGAIEVQAWPSAWPMPGELTILYPLILPCKRPKRLAIVGASGSGKSTLLGLLADWIHPARASADRRVDIYGLDEDGRALLRKEKLGLCSSPSSCWPT